MANQYTFTNPITREQIIENYYDNNMTQKELANKYNTTPKIVERLFKTYGLKARKAIKRNQFGSNNLQWNGGKTIRARYVLIKCRNHLRTDQRGYVYEHILIMEKHIGRYLNFYGCNNPVSEVVHHINEIRSDNRIENLKLMTIREHTLHHMSCNKKRGGKAV